MELVSMNLRKNGFDFSPPTGFQNTQEDDMEIKSVTTAAESERGGEDVSSVASGNITERSQSKREEKQEGIMKDWGFTDARVAQAMMKRAKRMNAGKKKQKKRAMEKDAMYRLARSRKGGGAGGSSAGGVRR